jgi:hypothetical protein
MNAQSFFSNSVFAPFFEDVVVEYECDDDDEEAAELDATSPEPMMISDSSHMCDRT